MTTEEKAKAYDEALKRAKEIHDVDYVGTPHGEIVEYIFPELKERFKVGDWIVNNKDNTYGIIRRIHDDNTGFEKDYHLWTIQDAKDGDVLVDKYGNIGIYQGDKNAVVWYSCCYCGVNKVFYTEGSHEFPCYPATKEQRELLFKKMNEAGYEWDVEKKKLDKVEQKQEWSDKDEEMAEELIKGFLSSESPYQLTHTCKEIVDWLKSLKDRMEGKEEKK